MIAFVLGYLQYGCAKRSFILLPLGWYKSIDKIIPNFIQQNMGYVTVESVEETLEGECGCRTTRINKDNFNERRNDGGNDLDKSDKDNNGGKDGYNNTKIAKDDNNVELNDQITLGKAQGSIYPDEFRAQKQNPKLS